MIRTNLKEKSGISDLPFKTANQSSSLDEGFESNNQPICPSFVSILLYHTIAHTQALISLVVTGES